MYVILAKSLKKCSIITNSERREVRKMRDCAHSGCNTLCPTWGRYPKKKT